MPNEAELGIVARMKDEATGPLNNLTGLLGGLGSAATSPIRAMGGLADTLGKVGLGVFGIKELVGGVADLAQGMVAGNAEFERYETQFTVLLGSSEEAKQRLKELADFGAKTPFELPEVVRADKILTSFGLDTQETLTRFKVSAAQIRTTIGDVASGTGASFEEIASTFGRFASGATGEAISRMQELGIATREQMASWGLQFSKSGELLTPAKEAFSVLEKHVRDKFGGMMDAQSTTFEGMVSNLQDWIGAAKRTMMAPLFDVLKNNLQALLQLLNSPAAQAALQSIAQGLANGIQTAIDSVGWLIGRVQDLIGYLDPSNTRDLMAEWFGDAGPYIDNTVRAVKALAEAFGQLLQGQGLGPLVDTIAEIASFSLGIDLWPLIDSLQRIGQVGKLAFEGVVFAVQDLIGGNGLEAFTFDLAETVAQIGDLLGFNWKPITDGMYQVSAVLGNLIAALASGDIGLFTDLLVEWTGIDLGPFLGWIQAAVKLVGDLAGAVGNLVMTGDLGAFVKNVMAAYQEYIPALVNFVESIGATLVQAIATYGPPILAALGDLLKQLWAWVQAQAPGWLTQLQAWGQAFVNWISPMVQPMLAALVGLAQQLWTWIQGQAGVLAGQFQVWASAFVEWIGPATKDFLTRWPGMLNEFLDWIATAAGPILLQLAKWALAFVQWIVPNIPNILLALGQIALAITAFILETAAVIALKLLQWGLEFVKWVVPQIPGLLVELGKLLLALGDWITKDAQPAIARQLVEWGKAFVDWVAKDAIPNIGKELNKLLIAIWEWVTKTAVPEVLNVGARLAQNLIRGFRDALRGLSIPLPTFSITFDPKEILNQTVLIPRLMVGIVSQLLGDLIPGLAAGTNHWPGGLAMVGEHGPEVLALPRGSAVYPSRGAAASAGAGRQVTVNQNLTINAPVPPNVSNEFHSLRSLAVGWY